MTANLLRLGCVGLLVFAVMGAVTVTEPLDLDQWTSDQQIAVRDALVAIVGPPPTDYTTWSVSAMNQEVNKIMTEMAGRNGAVVHYYQGVTVEGATIIQDPNNLPALQPTPEPGT